MCGIAGAFLTTGDPGRVVRRMTDALAHRGPDDDAVHIEPSFALGHRRLAILDPSPRARQPMESACGRYVIVHNGEVYNFRSLRHVLRDRGHAFRTETDAEVILAAFSEWGENGVRRLDGMFAFAIIDRERRSVLLARDRLGIKPLYWSATPDGAFLFASEVRALLASGLVGRRLFVPGVRACLQQQAAPCPWTILDSVRLLAPGTMMAVDSTGRRERTYWGMLEDADGDARNHELREAVRRIRCLLEAATERHLVSDVPVAAFLSGGLDSTAVVSLMAKLAASPPRTVTVALAGPRDADAVAARTVARLLGTDHVEVVPTKEDVIGLVPLALAHQDHPSADGVNTYLISRAVAACGHKVVVSGLGGDEIFGGYPSFRRLALHREWAFLWRVCPPGARRAAGWIVEGAVPSSRTRKLRRFLGSTGTLAEAFRIGRSVFSPGEARRLLARGSEDPSDAADPLATDLAAHSTLPIHTLVSFAESTTYLRDVLLRDTDQMSMAHGLEVRVPLLDHHLVEYVAGLAKPVLRRRHRPKQLLIDAVVDLLPAHVASRRKQGFVLPLGEWMRGPLEDYCRTRIDALAAHPAFDGAAVMAAWRAFVRHPERESWPRPWILVVLGAWLQTHGVH